MERRSSEDLVSDAETATEDGMGKKRQYTSLIIRVESTQ